MGSTVISIPDGELPLPLPLPLPNTKKEKERPNKLSIIFSNIISYLGELQKNKQNMRKLIHSFKVGIALVVVSLLYLLDPLFDRVGENAMWAIMTVVVIFEFFAGATLSKGLNRGLGTILGGGLGCLAAALAQAVSGIDKAASIIIIGCSVFIISAAGTYTRLQPSIKKRYDYAAMIFVLTFNLVIVSGLRADEVLKLARSRLSTIGMGFAVCIFISLLVFPSWASDELHDSIASKFQDLANPIEEYLENYFRLDTENDDQQVQMSSSSASCKSVLHSKSKDESLAIFAKWEPWHGKFGLYYPWNKYLQVGELLRDLATIALSFKACLESHRQPSSSVRQSMREPSKAIGLSLALTLRELGESVMKMRRSQLEAVIMPKLKSMRLELNSIISSSKFGPLENVEVLAISSFVFLLMEMVEKVEELAKVLEELGELAGFRTK